MLVQPLLRHLSLVDVEIIHHHAKSLLGIFSDDRIHVCNEIRSFAGFDHPCRGLSRLDLDCSKHGLRSIEDPPSERVKVVLHQNAMYERFGNFQLVRKATNSPSAQSLGRLAKYCSHYLLLCLCGMYGRFAWAGSVFNAVESTFDESVSNLSNSVVVQIKSCSNLGQTPKNNHSRFAVPRLSTPNPTPHCRRPRLPPLGRAGGGSRRHGP
jgi:hypothetical protein